MSANNLTIAIDSINKHLIDFYLQVQKVEDSNESIS